MRSRRSRPHDLATGYATYALQTSSWVAYRRPMTKPSSFVSFPAAADSSEEGYDAWHYVADVPDLSSTSLRKAIDEWAAALTAGEVESRLQDPALDGDPWFGFGVRRDDEFLSEADVMNRLDDGESSVEAFVRAVVAFNRRHESELEGPLYTHEELETGSGSIKWLLLRDLRYLDLYIEFLGTLDLDHTVAQVETVFALARRYAAEQVSSLTKWSQENHAQRLDDWLANDRAWKVRS